MLLINNFEDLDLITNSDLYTCKRKKECMYICIYMCVFVYECVYVYLYMNVYVCWRVNKYISKTEL